MLPYLGVKHVPNALINKKLHFHTVVEPFGGSGTFGIEMINNDLTDFYIYNDLDLFTFDLFNIGSTNIEALTESIIYVHENRYNNDIINAIVEGTNHYTALVVLLAKNSVNFDVKKARHVANNKNICANYLQKYSSKTINKYINMLKKDYEKCKNAKIARYNCDYSDVFGLIKNTKYKTLLLLDPPYKRFLNQYGKISFNYQKYENELNQFINCENENIYIINAVPRQNPFEPSQLTWLRMHDQKKRDKELPVWGYSRNFIKLLDENHIKYYETTIIERN